MNQASQLLADANTQLDELTLPTTEYEATQASMQIAGIATLVLRARRLAENVLADVRAAEARIAHFDAAIGEIEATE